MNQLLKGKKGIIFGALDEKSIAWKTANSCSRTARMRRSAAVRIAHLSQIQTFVTDSPLPAGIASICHHRGIEVVEAMEKRASDIDDPANEPAPAMAAPPVRLR